MLRWFIDTNWGGNLDKCKSTSRYLFLLNDYTILQCSKKQPCLALLIMKVDYVGCSLLYKKQFD